MTYSIVLAIILYAFWLLLSGYWDVPLLLALGAASVALVTYLMRQVDRKYPSAFSNQVFLRLPGYWLWLVVEIIKSNLDVLKRIWFPARYPIAPSLKVLPMTQQSRLGRTIYANSITLTPGTVAIEVQGQRVLVHAIAADGMLALEAGEMDRRVTALEKNMS